MKPGDNYYNQGWISLHRKVREHWIWQDSEKLKWWIDLLMEVNHKEKTVTIKNTLYIVNRGESINSLLNWAKRWKTTRGRARNFFKLLQKDQMILRKSNQQTTHITVLNYDKYQDKQPTTLPTNGQRTDNERTQTIMFNNEKDNERISDSLSHLNLNTSFYDSRKDFTDEESSDRANEMLKALNNDVKLIKDLKLITNEKSDAAVILSIKNNFMNNQQSQGLHFRDYESVRSHCINKLDSLKRKGQLT